MRKSKKEIGLHVNGRFGWFLVVVGADDLDGKHAM